MVIGKKKKRKKAEKEKKEKILCGGKLVFTDFGELDPQMFYDYSLEQLKEELSVYMPDGRVFINSGHEHGELISGIFSYLIPETRYHLEQFQKEMKRRFPDVKSVDDWVKLVESGVTENVVPMLAALMVPTEFQRRDIERMYYKKGK